MDYQHQHCTTMPQPRQCRNCQDHTCTMWGYHNKTKINSVATSFTSYHPNFIGSTNLIPPDLISSLWDRFTNIWDNLRREQINYEESLDNEEEEGSLSTDPNKEPRPFNEHILEYAEGLMKKDADDRLRWTP